MPEMRHSTVLDAGQQQLGAVYAKALLNAADKLGQADAVVDQFDSFVDDVLARLPAIDAVLSSPRIPLEAKERLLDRGFAKRMSPALLNFLKVVCRRGRFDCVRAMRQAAREQLNQLRGRVEVEVRSADPLDAKLRELVANRLRAALGKEVVLKERIDAALIGGIVLRVGDTVYDGSILNRLERLRDEVLQRSSRRLRDEADRFTLAD